MKKLITIGTLATLTFISVPLTAQDASGVADTAKQITVRIEGATQGSGVIVDKTRDIYTVLTAWHVIKSNRPGEEISIIMPDKSEYDTLIGNARKIKGVDLAVITFSSQKNYLLATLSRSDSVKAGENVYVSGFPLLTSAIPKNILRFLPGNVIANAKVKVKNGYQLLYSNQTLPGMSGGLSLIHI